MRGLKGKRVLITGASNEMGAGMVKVLACVVHSFLLSDATARMTGWILTIDGGLIVRGYYPKRRINDLIL